MRAPNKKVEMSWEIKELHLPSYGHMYTPRVLQPKEKSVIDRTFSKLTPPINMGYVIENILKMSDLRSNIETMLPSPTNLSG